MNKKKIFIYSCVAVVAFAYGFVNPLWSHKDAQTVAIVPYEVTTGGQIVAAKPNIFRSVSEELIGKYTVLASIEVQKIIPSIEVDRDANSMQPTEESLKKISQTMRRNNIDFAVLLFENRASIEQQNGTRHGELGVEILKKDGEMLSNFTIPYLSRIDMQQDTTAIVANNNMTFDKISSMIAEKSNL